MKEKMFAGSLKESHKFLRWFLSLLYEHARSHPRVAGDERVSLSLRLYPTHYSHEDVRNLVGTRQW
jgi:hypothetical protein